MAGTSSIPTNNSSSNNNNNDEDRRTPIAVVLGAGKTANSMIEHTLKVQQRQGWNICVLEQEWGEKVMDRGGSWKIVGRMPPKDSIVMDNGCVCWCWWVRGDFVQTLRQLINRRNKFDAILLLLETTGFLADPASIVDAIKFGYKVCEHYYIDSIIAVIDSQHCLEWQLDEVKKPDGSTKEAQQQQVAYADMIVLDRYELLSEDERNRIKAHLKSINPFATFLETEGSIAPLDEIWNVHSFHRESILSYDPQLFDIPEDDGPKGESNSVKTVVIQFEGTLHCVWFNNYMMSLLNDCAADLYRTKGVLCIHPFCDRKFVFQCIHKHIDFGAANEPWKDGEPRLNTLVFFGKNLDRDELTRGLMECVCQESDAKSIFQ